MGKISIVLIISLFCLLSCGLEDYLYIDYIPDGFINDNTFARIQLPSSSAEGYSSYFRRFEIYYRIYISGVPLSGLINTSDSRRQINNTLDSDFLGLYSLTDKTSTSANPSNLETVFSNRQYFKLALLDNYIDNVLGSGSLGRTLDIQFWTDASKPELILNGVRYTLQRARAGLSFVFNPEPNLDFLNSLELCNTSNITNEKNADVAAPNTNPPTPPEPRYTYVSMYIFAIGEDYITRIYSQPTHIGIFRLRPP
jgi:hypothetical protein